MKIRLVGRHKWKIVLSSLIFALLLAIAVFATIGSANITIADTIKIVLSKIPFINNINVEDIPDSYKIIILKVRIPRLLLGALVGASLSSVGTAFQGIFKNPMADPYIIGISSGAALGATIAIITGTTVMVLGFSSISFAAFVGAMISTFIVYFISKVKNKVPATTLLLSGIAVGQFFTAVMSFLMVIYQKDVTRIIFWTLGSFSGTGWNELLPVCPFMIASILLLNIFAKDLNIMLTGEESAQNLGVEVEKIKIYILIICSFTTALAVSTSGIIGFVGLIIPHIVRLLVGPDHRILIPSSALAGAIFMIFADTIARTIISPTEIPVGIITALFGGPFFIYLLRKKKKTFY